MNHVKRVIKQVEDFHTANDNYIVWQSVEEDFTVKKLIKSEMMKKYGFSNFQYKILRDYILGK